MLEGTVKLSNGEREKHVWNCGEGLWQQCSFLSWFVWYKLPLALLKCVQKFGACGTRLNTLNINHGCEKTPVDAMLGND